MDDLSDQPRRGKVVSMLDRIREVYSGLVHGTRAGAPADRGQGSAGVRRTPNLFEAAAAYVSARAEDDQDRIEETAGWVSPEALSFGVSELACRAVVALARERDESPESVARALLGLPTA